MAKRISQLTQLTAAQVAQGDQLAIVDVSAGQTKYVTVKDLTGVPDVGWTATGESWTFGSYNSATRIGVINVPSNATLKYSVGMRVRIAQTTGGTKWGFVVAVATTTLSVFFGQGITLNNEAITSPVYSVEYLPYGYAGPMLTKEQYQSDVTNTERWVFEVSGWGAMTFGSAISFIQEVVTLPLTYASIPIVIIASGGDQVSGTVALGNGQNSIHGSVGAKAHTLTTSTFNAFVFQAVGTNWSSGNIVYYQWHARGVVS